MSKKIREQIDYGDTPERMAPDIEAKIRRGETPLSKNPAFPEKTTETDPAFEEIVASKRFKDVVEKVKHYTGMENITGPNAFMELQMTLLQSVNRIKEIENQNEERLEELAVELAKKEMGIPEDAFQYDVEITSGMGQIDTSQMRKTPEIPTDEEIQQQFGVDSEEAAEDINNFEDAFERFNMEKAKRRFINSLIQGAAKKCHYMFALIEDELNQINPDLLNLYGVVMSINDLLYWIIPDQMLMGMTGEGGDPPAEGSEEIDKETNPPTIRAKGFMFPILLHEIVKAFYEVFGTKGLPDDPKAAEMVMNTEDTLPYEVWDLRLGPVIWEKFTRAYPMRIYEEDMREIQNYLFSRLSALTTDEFFKMAKLMLSGSEEGKKLVDAMVDEIIDELRERDYEDAISQEDDDDEPDGFRDMLGDLGISLT